MTKQIRGLRFANVSGGRADQFVDGRVVNAPDLIIAGAIGSTSARPRSSVPSRISPKEYRNIDRFGDEIFPFTGQYPAGTVFFFVSTGSWTDRPWSVSGSSFVARSRHLMAKLPQSSNAAGRVLIAGGYSGTAPLTGASYFKNDDVLFSSVNLPSGSGRSHAAGVTLSGAGDKVYVIHGGSGSLAAQSSTFFLEWPATGLPTWSQGQSSLVGRSQHSLVKIADGRIFAPGGTYITAIVPFSTASSFMTTASFFPPAYNSADGLETAATNGNGTWVVGSVDGWDGVGYRYLRSIDNGLTWTVEHISGSLFSNSHGNKTGLVKFMAGKFFVFTGQFSENSEVAYSTDGLTWTASVFDDGAVYGGFVTDAAENDSGVMVAVGYADVVPTFYSTDGGVNFYAGSPDAFGAWFRVKWSPEFSRFFAATDGYLQYSFNGVNWSTALSAGGAKVVSVASASGSIVAISGESGQVWYTAGDFGEWYSDNSPEGNYGPSNGIDVTYQDGYFWLLSTGHLSRSPNGSASWQVMKTTAFSDDGGGSNWYNDCRLTKFGDNSLAIIGTGSVWIYDTLTDTLDQYVTRSGSSFSTFGSSQSGTLVVTAYSGTIANSRTTTFYAAVPSSTALISEYLKTDLTWSGTLPIPIQPLDRQGYSLTLLNDNSVLLLGGRESTMHEYNSHALRFYPDSGSTPASWSIEPSMSFPRYMHQATLMSDGRVLVAGGSGGPRANLMCAFPMPLGAAPGSTESIDDAEIYDPVKRSWTSAGQMHSNRTRFVMLPMVSDGAGRVFVAGGSDGDVIHSSSEVFDADTISWNRTSPMRLGVRDSAAVILSSSLTSFQCLFVGGEVSSSSGFVQVSSSQVFTS